MRPIESLNITRRDILTAGAGALTAAAAPALAVSGNQESLCARANRKGLLVGSCLDILQVNDTQLVNGLSQDCNILIPENAFNWTRLQRTQGSPLDFSEAEAVAAVAKRIGVTLRGHNLVWYATMPAWVSAIVPTLTATQASNLMTSHVKAVASHWRGRVVHQEPVNEPTEAPGKLRSAVFGAKLGEHYIDLAFEAAREADPDAVLFINESGIEQETPWQTGCRKTFLQLLERLKKRNAAIDAVGVQGHLTLDAPFSQDAYARLLRDISDMGYKIMITEFDIGDKGILGSIAPRDAAVAALGKAFLDVSFDNLACGGVLDWSHVDKYSWLRKKTNAQRTDGQPLRPSPLDDSYKRKPLWYAMAAAIDGASKR
ncbi:MAG: hypothetical protein EOP14_01080 [Pseudomonas sp.]|nr:MAG: hypothetical protein EOP14_01080 [Pseudomonas sp.]